MSSEPVITAADSTIPVFATAGQKRQGFIPCLSCFSFFSGPATAAVFQDNPEFIVIDEIISFHGDAIPCFHLIQDTCLIEYAEDHVFPVRSIRKLDSRQTVYIDAGKENNAPDPDSIAAVFPEHHFTLSAAVEFTGVQHRDLVVRGVADSSIDLSLLATFMTMQPRPRRLISVILKSSLFYSMIYLPRPAQSISSADGFSLALDIDTQQFSQQSDQFFSFAVRKAGSKLLFKHGADFFKFLPARALAVGKISLFLL